MALIWSAAAPLGGPGRGAGAVWGGWERKGGRLVYAICHPAPAWHGSPRSGGGGGVGMGRGPCWSEEMGESVEVGGDTDMSRTGGTKTGTTSLMFGK